MTFMRAVRILEVPLLLLLLAFNSYTDGSMGWAVFILIISIVRLFINHVTDDVIYKK